MSRIRSLLTITSLPASTDLALLLLRVWLGLSMAGLHGWGKVDRLSADPIQFADPFGLGPGVSLALATCAELVAALLVALGLATRWAALAVVGTMGVAFVAAHGAALSGERSGELAFIYIAGFAAIVIAGPGRFSVDAHVK